MAEPYFFAHFAGDPFFNMAFDEWMFARALGTPGSILLRLYSWDRGAVTFGYHQNLESAVRSSRLGDTPIIRRITGGRALYHEPSEVTYSIAVNMAGPDCSRLAGSIPQVSRAIAGVLTAYLADLGISSEVVRGRSSGTVPAGRRHKAPCFASYARHEIVSEGQKVVASAQRRKEATIFQHGSIKINGAAPHPALPLGAGSKPVVADRVRPLSRASFERHAGLFRRSFGDFLGVRVRPGELGESEKQEVEKRVEMVRRNFAVKRDIF
ncbi:MAG: hypothetical protein JSW34_09405 [Candidatus Zixiibacteriota bacterium]|nr:MAG: hypothetical protein JSW34_09405 [candidate division Zixibacteria bacterium]